MTMPVPLTPAHDPCRRWLLAALILIQLSQIFTAAFGLFIIGSIIMGERALDLPLWLILPISVCMIVCGDSGRLVQRIYKAATAGEREAA
jgi:hypothetical protein